MHKAKIDDRYLGHVCTEVGMREDVTELIGAMLGACWERRATDARPFRPDRQLAVGLAANQVGSNLRLIVIDYAGFVGGMINPVITKYRGGTTKAKEQCLSFGTKSAYVERHKIIKVKWLDKDWGEHTAQFRGLMARIIQHEVDHLDGIDMFERERLGVPTTGELKL